MSARFVHGMIVGLCVITLGFLLQFAWLFADERLYADSGYYLFRVVSEGSFHVEHGRWVLVLAQALPLLGVKLGLGMTTIIMMHSMANVVFLALALAYCIWVIKDGRAALMVAMAQLVGLSHGLFCPVFELYYGTTLVLLFHATATSERLQARARMVIAILLFFGALVSHPMAWGLLCGSIVLLDRQQRKPLLPTLAVITVVFAVWRASTISTYEAAQIGFLQRLGFPSLVGDRFTPRVLLEQATRSVSHYPDVVALAVFTLVMLWRSKKRTPALIYLGGMLVLYVITGLYLPDPTHDRYREQVDFAFAAWTLLMVMQHTWTNEQWRPMLMIILVTCVGLRVMQASFLAPHYQARADWLKEHLDQARASGLRKAIVDPAGVTFGTERDHVSLYWSAGVESLLLSAKDGAEQCVSLITTDDLQCASVAKNLDKVVLRCWDVIDPTALPVQYFDLPTASYTQLPAVTTRRRVPAAQRPSSSLGIRDVGP